MWDGPWSVKHGSWRVKHVVGHVVQIAVQGLEGVGHESRYTGRGL